MKTTRDTVRRYQPWPEDQSPPEGWPTTYVDADDYDRLSFRLSSINFNLPDGERLAVEFPGVPRAGDGVRLPDDPRGYVVKAVSWLVVDLLVPAERTTVIVVDLDWA
jgi:hypothetical protein